MLSIRDLDVELSWRAASSRAGLLGRRGPWTIWFRRAHWLGRSFEERCFNVSLPLFWRRILKLSRIEWLRHMNSHANLVEGLSVPNPLVGVRSFILLILVVKVDFTPNDT